MNQLLYITHKIYKSLDNVLDVCSVFLDISKVFDMYDTIALYLIGKKKSAKSD